MTAAVVSIEQTSNIYKNCSHNAVTKKMFSLCFSSSDEEEINDQNHNQIALKRVIRPRINFAFLRVSSFKERFRVSPTTAENVLNIIGPLIQHRTMKNNALDAKQQLLVALHFFGTGCQYHCVGDTHGIHASTVCRIINRVVRAILNSMFNSVVRWPSANRWQIPVRFGLIAGFPRVAGAIDGTLINIEAPSEAEYDFVDRHGNHSINTMVVCGPDHSIYFASARWPGSVHDNRVLRNSQLFQMWETEGWRPFPGALLLGDSGYGNKSWLLTPNIAADFPPRGREIYMRRHKSTRQIVECSIGMLEAKFPCLRYLRPKSVEQCSRIILACITLYNIEIRFQREFTQRHIGREIDPQIPVDVELSADDVIGELVSSFEAEEDEN